MKKYLYSSIAILIVAFGFTACIHTNAPEQSNSADISFTVKSGTSKSIPTVTFTEQEKGADGMFVLTNVDSLPYLTKPDSLIPVITGTRLKSITIMANDTTINYTANKDTLDFSNPIVIVCVSEDGSVEKTYKVVVNIHQKDPDLYVWTPKSNAIYSENAVSEKLVFFDSTLYFYVKSTANVKLYTSKDGVIWTSKTLSNFPSFDIKYIVKNTDKLYISEGNKVYVSEDGISWTEKTANAAITHLAFALNGQLFGISYNPNVLQKLDTTAMSWGGTVSLPSNFPVEGEAICVSNAISGNERVFVVGGKDADSNLLNTVWSTENGSHWTNLVSKNTDIFTPRQDVAVIQYDNILMSIGGRDNSGVLGIDDYFVISPDKGMSWFYSYSNMAMPIDFVLRFGCQAVINDNKTVMYFVGGQNDSGFTKDAWSVMKNSVLWEAINNE